MAWRLSPRLPLRKLERCACWNPALCAKDFPVSSPRSRRAHIPARKFSCSVWNLVFIVC